MISSEVQRTLVKSPPELWAELSDPAALARHLGELGEIRITRAEPEKRVEWEADGTSGSVLIKPSGWGTKVTLSVTREIEAPVQEVEQDSAVEAEAVSEVADPPEPGAESVETDAARVADTVEPGVTGPEPETPTLETAAPGISAETESSETAESPTPSESVPQPAPRRGFFARLFGRRQPKVAEPAEASSAQATAENRPPTPSAGEPETSETTTIDPARSTASAIESLQARFQAEHPSEPIVEPEPEPVAVQAEQPHEAVAEAEEPSEAPPRDLAAELKVAEEVAAEQVTAVLTAVLDRLGAAHHRPFSRA